MLKTKKDIFFKDIETYSRYRRCINWREEMTIPDGWIFTHTHTHDKLIKADVYICLEDR